MLQFHVTSLLSLLLRGDKVARLDDGQLGSGDVESINIWCQPRERLLGSIGPVQSLADA